jgi:hypothetical protein
MEIQPLRDEPFPSHGHWVAVIGLTPLLAAADQRLNPVEPWADQRLRPRRDGAGQPGPAVDHRDARLATVLEAWRDDTPGSALEGALNQHLRWVDDLQPACVRAVGPLPPPITRLESLILQPASGKLKIPSQSRLASPSSVS